MAVSAKRTPPDLVCYSAVHVHYYHISIVCSYYIYVCNHINLDISLQTLPRKRRQEFKRSKNDSKKKKLDLSGTSEGESVIFLLLNKSPQLMNYMSMLELVITSTNLVYSSS